MASVTYYKAKVGDQISIIVPADEESETCGLPSKPFFRDILPFLTSRVLIEFFIMHLRDH